MGLRIRNATYRSTVKVTHGDAVEFQQASRDLKALVHAGYLVALGEGRGRTYTATDDLRREWQTIRDRRPQVAIGDPFAES